MNEIRKCPNCGAELTCEDEFCPECGTKQVPVVDASAHEVASGRNDNVAREPADGLKFGTGSRTNIGGNVNNTSTHHHTDNSVNTATTTTTNNSNTVNTSSVDQSSTVNSTTILMNEKTKEYCSVCGQVLDDSHARCPQCGKSICTTCLVPGKNRCQKCEKQAINDFRMAVKQTVLVSKCELSIVEREMLSQRAIDLDVEDHKNQIIEEVLKIYRPTTHAEVSKGTMTGSHTHTSAGNTSASNSAANTHSNSGTSGYPKGVGALNGNRAVDTTASSSKGGDIMKQVIIILAAVVCIGGLCFILLDNDKSPKSEEVQMEPVSPQSVTDEPQSTTIQEVKTPRKVRPNKPANIVKTDAGYDEGIKAYDSNDGLTAVKAFKKSGSAKSYYMLGIIYKNGCGNVGKNPMMARKYFKQAAKMGSEEAQSML